jgi:hypothetical protein
VGDFVMLATELNTVHWDEPEMDEVFPHLDPIGRDVDALFLKQGFKVIPAIMSVPTIGTEQVLSVELASEIQKQNDANSIINAALDELATIDTNGSAPAEPRFVELRSRLESSEATANQATINIAQIQSRMTESPTSVELDVHALALKKVLECTAAMIVPLCTGLNLDKSISDMSQHQKRAFVWIQSHSICDIGKEIYMHILAIEVSRFLAWLSEMYPTFNFRDFTTQKSEHQNQRIKNKIRWLYGQFHGNVKGKKMSEIKEGSNSKVGDNAFQYLMKHAHNKFTHFPDLC